MKISYNWLSTHIKTDLEVQKVSEILTNTGLEVEGLEEKGSAKNNLEGVVVGKVISVDKHPNADKLKVAMVDVGTGEHLQIVCGAPNIAEEQKVAVATIGSELPTPDGGSFKIKKAKLRGTESFGMICSEAELGVSENNDGIWVLEPSYKLGTPLGELIDNNTNSDVQIEIGLTPNRSDAMSHYGVARDLNAALNVLNVKTSLNPIDTKEFDELELNGNCPIEIEIKEPELAKRYAGLYFENIKVKESPDWLQERLKAIDINPTNNVVDITNFILHDLGQPLHAFDADKINGNKIIVQKLPKGTKFKALDEVEYTLEGHELMICDTKEGMCMAGVYGGLNSGVTQTTTKIFLESAYFDPVAVRKAAKSHGLNTDSSFRFERGVDPNMALIALKKAALLLMKYADAKVVGEITDFYPNPIEDATVILRYHKIDQLLGERLHREQIKEILNFLEIKIISESNETLEVNVPPYRTDVLREVDLIEEVLRIYGYNKISPPKKVSFSIVNHQEKDEQLIENTIAQNLISLGFYEAMNNSVIKLNDQKTFKLDENSSIKLLNPLSSDLALMRQSMLPGLLQNTAFNINRKNKNIKLFEFGKVYNKIKEKYTENYKLTILISGNKTSDNWTSPTTPTNFFTLKGVVVQVLNRLGIADLKEEAISDPNFSDALVLKHNDLELAKLGVVADSLLKQLDIDQKVYISEINWDEVLNFAMNFNFKFKEITKFPAVKRDLALLIEQEIQYKELYESCQQLGMNELRSMQLFDVYEGDKLPSGKKSYAMSFLLQNDTKTLSEVEIEEVMNKLIYNFKTNFNAELRN